MAGAAKQRVIQEKEEHRARSSRSAVGSSSGGTSSSGKASQSVKSAVSASQSHASSSKSKASRRGGMDGNRDPSARDPNTTRPQVSDDMGRNLDLGLAGWSRISGNEIPSALATRPKPSALGSSLKMVLNTFDVKTCPTKSVYQFEVLVGSGAEKRGLIEKVWHSKTVQKAIGPNFIFDGNRLAWGMTPIERELRLTVDMDAEQGRQPKPGKDNNHRIIIRQTNKVGFASLEAYLAGKADFNTECLEAINFLDHLFRETPSQRYTKIKRSFFARGQERVPLGAGVEAFKGVYASPRIAHAPTGARLTINLDVANGTFWTANLLMHTAREITGTRDINDLIAKLRSTGEKGRVAEDLKKRLRKVCVIAKHRGGSEDEYVIDKFIFKSAREHTFEKDGKQISIYDYFARQYNVRLQYPDLPLVKMTKGKNTVLPMEILKIKENQRYNFKMDERQTSAMIKVAATPPPDRWRSVVHGLGMLDWAHDPKLLAYGVTVDDTPKTVDGRLIPAPTVKFGQGEAKPGVSGRWDLKGKKFLQPNTQPLKSWAVCVVPGRRGGKPDKAIVEKFLSEFVKIYGIHGGKVENRQPAFLLAQGDDVGSWVTSAWNAAGNQVQSRP